VRLIDSFCGADSCLAGIAGSQLRLVKTLPPVCELLLVVDALLFVLPQLFLGDTNRTISETPMNQASSRSHCIFSIMLEARQAGSDIVRRSKLHLVDLAGSERVAKSGELSCACMAVEPLTSPYWCMQQASATNGPILLHLDGQRHAGSWHVVI
jgi:hypothetical protein